MVRRFGKIPLVAAVLLASFLVAAPPAAADAPAVVGDCFNYALDDMSSVLQMSGPGATTVPCSSRHTAVTVLVAPSTSLSTLPPTGPLTDGQIARLGDLRKDTIACRTAANKAVGGRMIGSQYTLNHVYQAGADGTVELRCDVVMTDPTRSRLVTLPDELDANSFRLCMNTKYKFVNCGRGKAAVVWHGELLNPNLNKPWPGAVKAAAMARSRCRNVEAPGWATSATTRAGWDRGGTVWCLGPFG
ncbi:MAG: hypothetical protein QG597_2708 [Actinomycetota bacterium]|jgi:hypothetical protein|nr:hypothetical protein [Actinomycetota bacterium]